MTTTQAVAMAVVRPLAVVAMLVRTRVPTPAAELISQTLTAATPEAVKEVELTSCKQ